MSRLFGLILVASACIPEPPESTDLESRIEQLEGQDVGALLDRLDALQARVDILEDQVADLQGQVDTSALEQRVADVESDISTLQTGRARVILVDTTLNVPADFLSVNDALRALDDAIIAGGATVTIAIADGEYAYDQPIVVDHRDGDNIAIVGNTSDASAVQLVFAGTAGVVVEGGNRLGLLDGVRLVGDGSGTSSHGLWLGEDSFVETGFEVEVTGFGGTGVVVERGSYLFGPYVASTDNAGNGFSGSNGSVLQVGSSVARDNGAYGYAAYTGTVIDAYGASSEGNVYSGFLSFGGSYVSAMDSHASANQSGGYNALFHASMQLQGASAVGNAWDGFVAQSHSFIDANQATASGNTRNGFYARNSSYIDASNATSEFNGVWGVLAQNRGVVNVHGSWVATGNSAGEASPAFGLSENNESLVYNVELDSPTP